MPRFCRCPGCCSCSWVAVVVVVAWIVVVAPVIVVVARVVVVVGLHLWRLCGTQTQPRVQQITFSFACLIALIPLSLETLVVVVEISGAVAAVFTPATILQVIQGTTTFT